MRTTRTLRGLRSSKSRMGHAGGTPAAPLLNALALSVVTVPENTVEDVVVGAILNKTSGSTVTMQNSAGSRFKVTGSNVVTGATPTDYESVTSHNITLRETKGGVGNSPRDTVITINVGDVVEGVAPDAPILLITSGATDNQPDALITGDLEVDDVVTISAFSDVGLTTLVDTGMGMVTVGGTLTITNQLGPLSDGEYWYTAVTTRAGQDSDPSNTENKSIDATAPTLSSVIGTKTGQTTADLSASTNEANGSLFGVVTTSATPPTTTQVKTGKDHTGASAAFAYSQAVSATGAQPASATGLIASTTYYHHSMQEDAVGNQSSVGTSFSFTTDAASGTTLNAADKSSHITLTGGDLIETADATGGAARSTTSHASGKHCFKVSIASSAGPFDHGIGVSKSIASLDVPDTDSVVWYPGGGVYKGGSLLASVENYGAGSVLTIAVDADNARIWFLVGAGAWNNDGSADPATNTNGIDISALSTPWFVHAYGADNAKTFNFIVVSPPSGFGDY